MPITRIRRQCPTCRGTLAAHRRGPAETRSERRKSIRLDRIASPLRGHRFNPPPVRLWSERRCGSRTRYLARNHRGMRSGRKYPTREMRLSRSRPGQRILSLKTTQRTSQGGQRGGPGPTRTLYATAPLPDQFKLAAAAEAATKLPWGGAREMWPRNQANMPLPQTGPQPNPITGGPMAPRSRCHCRHRGRERLEWGSSCQCYPRDITGECSARYRPD